MPPRKTACSVTASSVIALLSLIAGCISTEGIGEHYTDWDRAGACRSSETEPWGVSAGGTALGPCMFPGKFVWITYFALWCKPCAEQGIQFREASRDLPPDAVLVAVFSGGRKPDQAATVADLREWSGEFSGNPKMVVSEGASARTVPQHALIGPDGRTWYRYLGPLEAGAIRATLDAFRSGARQPAELGP